MTDVLKMTESGASVSNEAVTLIATAVKLIQDYISVREYVEHAELDVLRQAKLRLNHAVDKLLDTGDK